MYLIIIANEENALALITANKIITTQNKEKIKWAAELIIANKELAFQNEEFNTPLSQTTYLQS